MYCRILFGVRGFTVWLHVPKPVLGDTPHHTTPHRTGTSVDMAFSQQPPQGAEVPQLPFPRLDEQTTGLTLRPTDDAGPPPPTHVHMGRPVRKGWYEGQYLMAWPSTALGGLCPGLGTLIP